MHTKPSSYSDLCAAVGHIIINWASAEQTLDICVTITYRFCGGNRLRKELPRSLSAKTAFMREALRKLDALKQFPTNDLSTIEAMEVLAKTRNDMVHGALAIPRAINGVWHFMKFDYGTDIHTGRDVCFSIDDFRNVGRKTQDLEEGLLLLASRLKRLAPLSK